MNDATLVAARFAAFSTVLIITNRTVVLTTDAIVDVGNVIDVVLITVWMGEGVENGTPKEALTPFAAVEKTRVIRQSD